ncbi:MAG: NAD-dependent epimerase/dehydratase family protein [Cytophagales bacterium]|nr:NAD-dependent epimerase/dehydratase family protein [Cytophagales bacterium]MDW8384216.1 NAD-dependent epimerase/dehydratase family protein [Flammeovirgaceae bacterium]
MKTALLTGATGLVGSQLLNLLLNQSDYEKIIVIARRTIPTQHPKINYIITDFERLSEITLDVSITDAYCCLGTTLQKAGSRAAFRKVDYEYVYLFAKLAQKWGAKRFLFVSAVGANKKSIFFYSRVKGEIEEAISQLGFELCAIFRPSLLLGKRNEIRIAESIAAKIDKLLGFLIPKRYRAVSALKVARAMLEIAKSDAKGNIVIESEQIHQYSL